MAAVDPAAVRTVGAPGFAFSEPDRADVGDARPGDEPEQPAASDADWLVLLVPGGGRLAFQPNRRARSHHRTGPACYLGSAR